MWTVYFDLDGVMADFDRGISELTSLTPRNQEVENEAADDLMWAAVRQIDHFYDKLQLKEGAKELFDAVYNAENTACEILTGIPKERRHIIGAGEDKISWVHRLLSPDVRVNIVYKEEKKNFVRSKHCILIDDYSKNISEWEDCGGLGIKFDNAKDVLAKLKELGVI